MQEEWESEEERNRIAEEKATNEALIRNFDDIKARIEADRLLAEKLHNEERSQFTNREKEQSFSKSTIAAQRIKFLAQTKDQRPSITDHDKESTEKSNDDLAMKHVGKPSSTHELENQEVEEIQALIKEESKEEVKKENKEEESTRKRKLAPDEEKEVDYEILDRKYPIKEWKTECLGTKPQVDKAEHLEEINQNVVIRSNGQKRYFSTLMRVLSIFNRDDLNAIYQLVMDKYQDEIPGGFDKVLWGFDLVMFNPDDEDKFWNSAHKKQDWKILESEEDSTMALELIRFVKKLLAELEPEDADGDEKDL
ncbi:hypothetical protein Tco_0327928 [Tanacetum coccineum]